MKRMIKPLLLAMCLLLMGTGFARAEEAPVFTLQMQNTTIELRTEIIDEEPWLFLPAFAQLEQLSMDGYELEWWDTEADEEGLWYVDILQDEESLTVNVMRSENLRSLFLFSDDPVHQGIRYIESDPNHDVFATATLAMVNIQGNIDHVETIVKLRGRGNSTWQCAKRPYQIKLKNRVDLLDTGNSANRSRTWVLLAEAFDGTLLHNRITNDLARELNILAMDSEFVDLYYDGMYRGTYVLSEKVEVGKGRLEIIDYDQLIEEWNNKAGQYNLDSLPVLNDTNRYKNQFTYVDGIAENGYPGTGDYLIEMESIKYTLSDRCYFELEKDTDTVYSLKNPESASRDMMLYISERLKEAQETLRAGGIHPINGRTVDDYFDVEAFARIWLLNEFANNIDGFSHSSSYFVLPAGKTKFEPGPVWDFDLAYRYSSNGSTENGSGFKERTGWMAYAYQVPAFLETIKKVYLEELYPLVQHVLLGGEESTYLKPLAAWRNYLSATAAMNVKRWGMFYSPFLHYTYTDSWEVEFELMKQFITQRSEWLYRAMNDLQPIVDQPLYVWLDVKYANPDDGLIFQTAAWQNIEVELLQTEQITEADKQNYAMWQLEAVVKSVDNRSLEKCNVVINGIPITAHLQEDNSLLIRALYEDQSYRPVDYHGEDVGLIYQYEKYIEAYPSVAEELEYDEQAITDYFFDEGIYMSHVGNGFFYPKQVAIIKPDIQEYLYDDWSSYYWEFISWGYDADWLDEIELRYEPRIVAVP